MTQFTNIRIKKSVSDTIKNVIIPHYKKTHQINNDTKISIPFIIDQLVEYVIKEENIKKDRGFLQNGKR